MGRLKTVNELGKIYHQFKKLGSFLDREGNPFCQSCSFRDLCCVYKSPLTTIFLFPFEKEFLEKNLKFTINSQLVGNDSKVKLEILEGTRESKCPFFEKGVCRLYPFFPLDCRLYPYAISYEDKPEKGFYLVRYHDCLIRVGKRTLSKVKDLSLKLINSLPMSYWRLYDKMDVFFFGTRKKSKPQSSYEIVAPLKIIDIGDS